MERKLRITVDGRPYIVTVEELGESSNLLYPQPGSMTVPSVAAPQPVAAATTPAAAPPAGAAQAAGPGDVLASLGGVVESIPVSVGQAVNQGDSVVVLEAMKMRSPMIAPRAGTVTRIAVKPGEAVEAGQLLVTIS
jgi:biotin carboxyl carrier protein